ncbi:MAG: PKD domain-containing protein [Flavobacteriales bacterium]
MLRKLIFLVLVSLGLSAHATHMSGGEIYWECIGNNQFRITMVVYRDCAGINVDPSYTLQVQSPCGNTTLVVSTPGGVEISQLCDMELPNSTCNGGSLPGIQQYIYTGTITLPPCDSWTISYTNIYRNNAIVNLQNPGAQRTYIRATLNNAASPCNDSPQFTNTAIPFVCMGYPITYSFGAFDPEGDSLSYTLIDAMGINGAPLAYVNPSTGQDPIPGLTLDPVTGEVNFVLNVQGNWVVVVEVNHYVNGVLVGTVMRDMQFVAYPCTNDPPDASTGLIQSLTGTAILTGPRAIQVCESGSFCFDAVISDPNAINILDAFSNIQQNLPGATFSFTGTNPITCHICWTAQPGTAGFFPFIVNVNDGACPIPAFQTYVYAVTVFPGLYGTIATTDENCTGTADGTATVNISAGTAPFTYVWNTTETTPSIVAGAGTYTVVATDDNGCVSPVMTGTIATNGLPNQANAGPDAVGCMNALPVPLSGSVVNATGGSWTGGNGSFSGTWPNVSYNPSAADIASGSVTLTLTTTGNTTCPPATDQVLISLPNSFATAAITHTDAFCFGAANGTATFSPNDPTFTYLWNDPAGQTTATATGLLGGNYSVTATDAFGCSITLNTPIGPMAAITLASLTATDEPCAGGNDGTATASATGGTAPYTYTWSNSATGPSITTGAGTYTVSVTDVNGCTPATGTITINATGQPNQANAGPDQIACMDALPVQLSGSVTNATGGTWTGGFGSFTGGGLNPQYNPSATDIANGSVTLTLTTSGNTTCPPASDQVSISLPNSFATASISHTDALCNGSTTGTATFAPNNPTFTYLWSDPAGQTTAVATGLGAGTYSVTATDASGCTTTLNTTVAEPNAIAMASLTATDEPCAGGNDGTATATVTGGTAPYTYTWSNSASGPSITAGAGTYTVSVTDVNGCAPATGTITINATGQPNQANAGPDQIACMDALPVQLSGSVTNATGGTWTGGLGSFTGGGLNPQYNPSATDIANGGVTLTLTTSGNATCPPANDQVYVSLPNSFASASISHADALCNGSATGTATFAPNNPTFTFLWNDPAGQTSATATGLGAGNYSVTATDAFGCSVVLNTTIGEPAAIALVSLTATDETCAGFGNGTVIATAQGGTIPYTYNWSNGASGSTITVGAGTYAVSITDANGCVPALGTATVNATGQPNSAAAGPDLIGCMNAYPIPVQGAVQNATGGAWSGGSGTIMGSGLSIQYMPTAAEVVAGGVNLTLTTTGNTTCPPASDVVHITLSNSFLNAALTPTNISCNGLANGSIAFTPANPSFTYYWSDINAQTTPTATGLIPAIYTVTVTDPLGCDTTLSATITEPAALAVTQVITTNATCAGYNNGGASLTIAGGTPVYSVLWSNGQSGPVLVGVAAGTYTANISDTHGCVVQIQATINQPPAITLTAQGPDTVCVNSPVTLTAQASGGTGTLLYNWGGLGFTSTITVAFQNSQTVQVTVSDQAGCSGPIVTLPITVLNLSTATLTTYGDTTVCPGGSATVSAALTGYPGNYTISWPDLGTTGNGPFVVPISGDQNLAVIVTDECGNTLNAIVPLRLDVPPAIQLPPVIAEGCAPLTVQMPNLQLGFGISYQWDLGNGTNSGNTAPLVTYPAGTYSVSLTVTTAIGCTSTTPSAGLVIAYPSPTASFTASAWTADLDNANIAFTDQSTGNINTWDWTFGDGGTSSVNNPTHQFVDMGTFNVELFVTDIHGCTASVDQIVTITPVYDVVIPTAFTPNTNGGNGGIYDPNGLDNDVFYAFYRFVKDFRMRIFNRWGELVFESTDPRIGWDGYYRGELSPQDVYVVQTWLRFVDGKQVNKLTDLTLFR